MTSKDQLLDFLNIIFALLLIAVTLLYFLVPGNFEKFRGAIKALAPAVFFAGVLIVRLKMVTNGLKKSQADNVADEIIIYLTHWDKAKYDIILIGLPIFLVLITFFDGGPNVIDVVQVSIVFLINLLVLRSIFSKRQ